MFVPGIFALAFGPAKTVIFPERGLQSSCPNTPIQLAAVVLASMLTFSQLTSSVSASIFQASLTPRTDAGQASGRGVPGSSTASAYVIGDCPQRSSRAKCD